MEQIVVIVSFLALFAFIHAKLQYELHMMQLNSYRNKRYYRWLRKHLFEQKRVIELIFCIIITLIFFTKINYATVISIIVLYSFLSYSYFSKKQKKPLVYTKRAKRLYVALWILTLTPIIVTAVFLGVSKKTVLIGCGIIVFSFLIIGFANIILQPVEKKINNWYYKDAQRILKQMPELLVIGITGSYGKTSTKHFLHRILSEKYNVLMTPGSFNTTMGVIRTIREYLKPTHQVFIVEMGAKQIGDIKEICDLVNPKYGILTAVGEQHLETFKTIENVQKTKFELIDSLPPDGLGILNADYEYIRNKKVDNCKTLYYSTQTTESDYSVANIKYSKKGATFNILQKTDNIGEFETKLLGDYNLSNILASVILARHLKVDLENISYAIKKMVPVQHRMEIKKNNNGITIIDDAFNSNPVGAKMALNVLKNIEGTRKIIITPGMIELADKQDFYNRIFGKQISDACDYVVLVGKQITQPIYEGLVETGYKTENIYIAQNFTEASQHISKFVKSGDVILYENDLPDTYEK
ncbi:UDP-N-acetylmuramoyl-tripeptide--D-alanyl-D-alanine ligase [Maribellus maritimus]|uniref:UDP-N-acetylmuramoyl-tripeptide--D-alanyl-D- alanine ligase n=1 Tax=Maribellus maritimus TaxID=2870838 RepID=UPI001EEB2A2B|nr:UDP-N-acetylmuramoyl-tripeptide--D-alanyl-D-alanine ligase [Maribellus maritimus]MCG6186381.1 UDP-N-acetylmuramoyl-tripeptide--D-alanyl-D-alanine ligase [Maribellus maritimus]